MCGYYIVFKTVQRTVRKEIKSRIKQGVPDEELTIIEFSDYDVSFISKLQWVNDNEFRFEGRLYDIVRIEKSAEKTQYFCINDKQEENLFAGLDKLTKENCNSSRNANQKQTNLLSKLIHDALYENVDLSLESAMSSVRYSALIIESTFIMQDIPYPPPKQNLI